MLVVVGFECLLRVSWGLLTLESCWSEPSDLSVEPKLKFLKLFRFLENWVVFDKEPELFRDLRVCLRDVIGCFLSSFF